MAFKDLKTLYGFVIYWGQRVKIWARSFTICIFVSVNIFWDAKHSFWTKKNLSDIFKFQGQLLCCITLKKTVKALIYYCHEWQFHKNLSENLSPCLFITERRKIDSKRHNFLIMEKMAFEDFETLIWLC